MTKLRIGEQCTSVSPDGQRCPVMVRGHAPPHGPKDGRQWRGVSGGAPTETYWDEPETVRRRFDRAVRSAIGDDNWGQE